MKKTYKFYIIRANIHYPSSKVFKSYEEYKSYINELARTNAKIARLNENNDYDKIYSLFNHIKQPPKTSLVDKGESIVETNIYYLVQCTYTNNKLTSHIITDCRYPDYIQQYKREVI